MRTEQKNKHKLFQVSDEFGTLGEINQHQQLPTTIPYLHLKSISSSPDVGTRSPEKFLIVVCHRPAGHHLAKPNKLLESSILPRICLDSSPQLHRLLGFMFLFCFFKLQVSGKTPLHSKVSYWLLVSLPPLCGCLIQNHFVCSFWKPWADLSL